MAFYKQSTAYTRTFKMIDSADHFSKKAGLTCTVSISKAGAAFAGAAGTVTEVANGWYKIALTTADTNTVGDLSFYITAAGADDTDFVDQVWVRDLADLAFPATSGRSMVVDASGLVDANTVKLGPTGSGTAQTARDIGTSVLLSTGTGTGQLDFTSGVVKANATQWVGGTIPAVNVTGVPLVDAKYLLGTIFSTPTVAGIPNVNAKTWNDLATVALPLVPTTAGRTLDVSVGGEAGLDWANIGSPTTSVALTGTTIATTQKVDVDTIKTNPVVNAGTITFPTTATLASTTNITAGTVTTATNLTNAPTAGDFTATMKTSLNNATPAVTVSDKTGFSLSAAGVQAIWDALTSALTTVGSIGKLLVTNIDAAISGRMATYTQPTGFLAATFPSGTVANTTNITAGTITTATNLTNAPTAGDFTATMKTSIGTAVAASAVASVTGNVGGNVAGSVGSVVGLTASNLDTTVSSRLAISGYTAPDNTSVTAIKAKTDSLTFTQAGQVDSNIQYVNDVQVTGNGTVATPWGP